MKGIKKTKFLSNKEGEDKLRKILRTTGIGEEVDLEGKTEMQGIQEGGIEMMMMTMKKVEKEVEGQVDEETGVMTKKRLMRDLKTEAREIGGKGEMLITRNMTTLEDVIVIGKGMGMIEEMHMKITEDAILIEGLIVSKGQGEETEIRDCLEEEMTKKEETIKITKEDEDSVTGTEVKGKIGDRMRKMKTDNIDKVEGLEFHRKTGMVDK